MTKAQVIILLDMLPDEFEPEDFIKKLLFVQHLEERIAESDADQLVSETEMRAYLNQWMGNGPDNN